MAAIDVSDVAAAIGRDINDDNETLQVQTWIDDVDIVLTDEVGDLTKLDQGLLRYVEREAVVDRMRTRSDQDAQAALSNRAFFQNFLKPWWQLLGVADPTGPRAMSVSMDPGC